MSDMSKPPEDRLSRATFDLLAVYFVDGKLQHRPRDVCIPAQYESWWAGH